jgi:hypothetical protein
MEAVNGFDEMLDYGNDCHMQNIRDRVALLGGQVSEKKNNKGKKKQTSCRTSETASPSLADRCLKKKIIKEKKTDYMQEHPRPRRPPWRTGTKMSKQKKEKKKKKITYMQEHLRPRRPPWRTGTKISN